MAVISKTQGTAVLAHTAITHPASLVGADQDVTTKLAATIVCFHAPVENTANTNPGSFYIQVSGSSSGDEDWVTAVQFTPGIVTAVTEPFTATEPVGEKVCAVTSTTGFVATNEVYIINTTIGNGEWTKIEQIVSNTSIDLLDGLTTEQTAAASDFWSDAEKFTAQLDLTAIGRLRVIFQHEGATGANVHVKALMISGDSIA